MEDETTATATANAGPKATAFPGAAESKGRGKTQPSDHPASDAPTSEPPVARDAQSTASSVESTTKKPASASARMNARGEAKKPSPRVPKSADDQPKKKSDKRKSTSAGKQTAAMMTAPAANAVANSTMEKKEPTDNQVALQAAANSQPRGSVMELLPGQDTELRKEYLHRIYHQLRITHQNQNDEVLRQIATNIEMDVCLKATTRNEYILALNQQINGLIQADVARGKASQQAYSDSSSGPSPRSTPGHPSANRFQPSGPDTSIQKSRIIAYTQTQAPHVTRQTQVQNQTQDISMNSNGQQQGHASEGSFVHSLLSNQNPMQAYEQSAGGSSEMQGAGPGSLPMNGQYYNPSQGRVAPNDHGGSQSKMEMQMQQQSYMQQRQTRSQPVITTLQEFAVQVQHFEKSQMIELLWSQRNSLLQWQRRATQLEMQLNLQQQARTTMGMNMNGAQGGYYNDRQMQQPLVANVPPNVSSEAELQRENERRNARAWQEQQQYQSYSEPGPEYGGAGASNPQTPAASAVLPSMHIPGTNPSLYWKKVQTLKSAYARELYFAHRALSQHNAPPNSAQSNKADNVKHNIGVAISVLNETPKAIQPRPFDVLDAIERFIVNTVVPIVRKVQSGMVSHSQSMTSPGNPTGDLSAQTGQDPNKGSMGGRVMMNNNIPPNQSRLPAMPSENKSYQSPNMVTKVQNSSSTSLNSMTSTSSSGHYYSVESAPVALANKSEGGRSDESRKPKPSISALPVVSAIHDSSNGNSRGIATSEAKDNLKATDSKKVNPSMEDNLNDFSDFPDLDFEDDLTDMTTSKYNKENSSSFNPKKRSIADI